MILVKMGKYHKEFGINCQDFAADYENIKIVVDGCSDSAHSEVGAKLFCNLLPKCDYSIKKTFERLCQIFETDKEIKDYLLFTILILRENEDNFYVSICGDGYVILRDFEDNLELKKYEYGSEPPYYAYNKFSDKSCLTKYYNGVQINEYIFSKTQYKSVGISSDGLDYIVNSNYKNEFIELLKRGKPIPIKRFINKYENTIINDKNQRGFQDDISIAIF